MTDLIGSKLLLGDLIAKAVGAAIGEIRAIPDADAPDPGPRRVPRDLRLWLARLRLLESVPFSHLVADTALLPPESIRFFHLDRGWTDALVEGALSVGTVTTADRGLLEDIYPIIRDEVDEAERLVRLPGHQPGKTVPAGPAGPVTGFVLRSRMVSGWPALHVRGYGHDNLAVQPRVADDKVGAADDTKLAKLGLLRMERLAPAVLLVLFDGLPRVIHVEEPRAGVQYGIDEEAVPGGVKAVVPLRDVSTGDRLPPKPDGNPVTADVPFRRGAPGVVHLATLAERMGADGRTNVGGELDAAEFGIQMLQFPWRAVFGDQTLSGGGAIDVKDLFRPAAALQFDQLTARFLGVVDG